MTDEPRGATSGSPEPFTPAFADAAVGAPTAPAGGTRVPASGERPYPVPQPPKKPRSKWWLWTIIAILAILLVCGCPFASIALLMNSSGEMGSVNPAQGRIAVIPIDGPIAGIDSGGVLAQQVVTPERVIRQLRRADADPTVRAIMLRIDSPGGTASASEEIADQVKRTKKPVLADIADVGASGAYMVASQSDEIMATAASDVGSIGVILQLTEYPELLKKIGVKQFAIKAGKYKDAGAPWRSLTPTEAALFQQDADLVYEQFIGYVAEGRDMEPDKVRELATGWAWPGERAKELGLVDRIGNYSDAVQRTGELGGIKGYPAVVDYGATGLLDLFGESSGGLSRFAPLLGLGTEPLGTEAKPLLR
jgi:protease-4